jgi:60 kDa SS-A/Ro ribonucleoprotein
MVNKSLFGSAPGSYVPPADATNEAGGRAYAYTPEQALANLACTGTLNGSFYTGAKKTLEDVKALCEKVDSRFIAATAVYARKNSFMKDMPALLLAILAGRCKRADKPWAPGPREHEAAMYLELAAPHVLDNGKMIRNFVQIVRSGQVGRKSFGTVPRRVVEAYLNRRHPEALFRDIVGNDPTLRDVIRLARPKPKDADRAELLAYLAESCEKTDEGHFRPRWKPSKLPAVVQQYEEFKAGRRVAQDIDGRPVPNVPKVDFRMLDSLNLTKDEWAFVAAGAGWQMARMNLNTFKRHGVFDDPYMVKMIAERLRDDQAIRGARVFPYQLLTAFQNTTDIPAELSLALQDAMEIATKNIEPFGRGAIAVDVSGSMSSPITGYGGKPSVTRCVDVAALIAAVLMRKEPQTIVLPFDTSVYIPNRSDILNPRDSIMTLANQLAKFGGGGTDCSLPMKYLIEKKVKGLDYLLYASDNESWVDSTSVSRYTRQGTATLQLWEQVKQLNPTAKLICINIAQSGSSQAPTRRDILNVGGFSDDVFRVAESFVKGRGADHWVEEINKAFDLLTVKLD